MIRPLPVAIALIGVLGAVKATDLVTHGPGAGHMVPSAAAATGTGEATRPARGAERPPSPPAVSNSNDPKMGDGKPGADKGVGGAAATNQPPSPPPPTEAELRLLTDLRDRRTAMDKREQSLAARESVVGAAEQRLSARVGELESLQARLEQLETARREHDEANWRGLVRTYEAMKPKDAAAIMTDLDDSVLLPVLDRMKDAKVAPILSAMPPDRARTVTAQLAEMRTRAVTPAPATGS